MRIIKFRNFLKGFSQWYATMREFKNNCDKIWLDLDQCVIVIDKAVGIIKKKKNF